MCSKLPSFPPCICDCHEFRMRRMKASIEINHLISTCICTVCWNPLDKNLNIHCVQSINNTFLILSCNFSEQPQFAGAWTLQCVASVSPGCWHMLTQMLATVVSSWLDVFWVVDHSWYTRETVECEELGSAAALDTLVHLAPTPIPHSKALKSFVLPIHLMKGTHPQYMSIHNTIQGLKIII